MIKLLGSVLVAGAAAWMGVSLSAALRRRVRALEELTAGLLIMEQELDYTAPELEVLLSRLAENSRGCARELFKTVRASLCSLGERSVCALWADAVDGLADLTSEGKQILCALGPTLGKFDSREQHTCVQSVRTRLEQLRAREEENCRTRCRTCNALALSGGAFLVILLL